MERSWGTARDLLVVSDRQEGEGEESAQACPEVGEEEEERGGQEDSQVDHQGGGHVIDGVHLDQWIRCVGYGKEQEQDATCPMETMTPLPTPAQSSSVSWSTKSRRS